MNRDSLAYNTADDIFKYDVLSVKLMERFTKTVYVKKSERIINSYSSIGMQIKWKSNNQYVKLNNLGYEDIAEIVSCWVLKNIKNLKSDWIKYYPCTIVEDDKVLGRGCYSYEYKNEGEEEFTFSKILKSNLQSFAINYDDLRMLILDDFHFDVKDYLDEVLCLDAIVRNGDRHFGNLSLLCGSGVRCSPIFDNGDSCLSDCITNPLSSDFDKAFNSIMAKPFYSDFNRQLTDNKRLLLPFDFLDCFDTEDSSAPFTRAIKVIERGLELTRGIAWEGF